MEAQIRGTKELLITYHCLFGTASQPACQAGFTEMVGIRDGSSDGKLEREKDAGQKVLVVRRPNPIRTTVKARESIFLPHN